ncbi:MAG TPA: hypothetical protein VFJ19_13575 [Nocardioidaceae bacterium]|nr:hypothetical protein [Nocardioidaceae bacterium]
MSRPLACLLAGHRWYFEASGTTLSWGCGRGCPVGGSREYPTAQDARHHAVVLSRGAPRPPLGLLSALAGTVHREPRNRPDDPDDSTRGR